VLLLTTVLLALAGLVLLLLGYARDSLALIYLSIGCTAAAGVALIVLSRVRLRRDRRLASEVAEPAPASEGGERPEVEAAEPAEGSQPPPVASAQPAVGDQSPQGAGGPHTEPAPAGPSAPPAPAAPPGGSGPPERPDQPTQTDQPTP
jgi:hypothetical protein